MYIAAHWMEINDRLIDENISLNATNLKGKKWKVSYKTYEGPTVLESMEVIYRDCKGVAEVVEIIKRKIIECGSKYKLIGAHITRA